MNIGHHDEGSGGINSLWERFELHESRDDVCGVSVGMLIKLLFR